MDNRANIDSILTEFTKKAGDLITEATEYQVIMPEKLSRSKDKLLLDLVNTILANDKDNKMLNKPLQYTIKILDEAEPDKIVTGYLISIAAALNHTELVKVLINAGADVNVEEKIKDFNDEDIQAERWYRPYMYACANGNIEIFNLLHNENANVDLEIATAHMIQFSNFNMLDKLIDKFPEISKYCSYDECFNALALQPGKKKEISTKKLWTARILADHNVLISNPFEIFVQLKKYDQRDPNVLFILTTLCNQQRIKNELPNNQFREIETYQNKLKKLTAYFESNALKTISANSYFRDYHEQKNIGFFQVITDYAGPLEHLEPASGNILTPAEVEEWFLRLSKQNDMGQEDKGPSI